MLHNMHYHVGERLQQQEEEQAAAEKPAQDDSEVHRDYPCVGIEHHGTDVRPPDVPRSVVEVREDMVAEENQGSENDICQIPGTEGIFVGTAEHAGSREYQKEYEISQVEGSIV